MGDQSRTLCCRRYITFLLPVPIAMARQLVVFYRHALGRDKVGGSSKRGPRGGHAGGGDMFFCKHRAGRLVQTQPRRYVGCKKTERTTRGRGMLVRRIEQRGKELA